MYRTTVGDQSSRMTTVFYYLMRHESYGRRTTDVAVCVGGLRLAWTERENQCEVFSSLSTVPCVCMA
jgi:hypothetical protein